jgi:hypothetical protein
MADWEYEQLTREWDELELRRLELSDLHDPRGPTPFLAWQ